MPDLNFNSVIAQAPPGLDALVHLSLDGLPLSWWARGNASVEEITSIATALFLEGRRLHLAPQEALARMTIQTNYGTLVARELPDATLLLVLLDRSAAQSAMDWATSESLAAFAPAAAVPPAAAAPAEMAAPALAPA